MSRGSPTSCAGHHTGGHGWFDESGNALTGVNALNQFYQRSPAINRVTGVRGDFLSDPKCYFDPVGNRFIQTILEVDAPGNFNGQPPFNGTHVLIAVSQTSDPTSAWNLYSIDTSDDGLNGTPAHRGCPCLPDQPLLGANQCQHGTASTVTWPCGCWWTWSPDCR